MKHFQNQMIKKIEGTKGKVRSKLNIKIYELTDKDILSRLVLQKVDRANTQIIFLPYIFLSEAESYLFYAGFKQKKILIYPYFFIPESLNKAAMERGYDLFRIPDLIQETILSVDAIVLKVGYNLDSIKFALREVEISAQKKFKRLEEALSKGVLEGIEKWRKEIKGNITYEAGRYLETSIKSNTLFFLETAPENYRDSKWLQNNIKMETVEFLKTYSSETGQKTIQLNNSLKSGVNNCKSLPCKMYCCEKYREWNHKCLKKLNCP